MTMPGVSDATGRITLRRRGGRRRRILMVAIVVVAVAAAGTLAWLLLGSDVFGVRDVAVRGNKLVSAAEVEQVAAVPPGEPLARVDLDGIATRVAGLPAVARVTVARQWPDAISIGIVERTPALAIETPGGYWIADDQGVVFDSATQPPRGVPAARMPTADPRLIGDVATVLRAVPPHLRRSVHEVRAATPDSITLSLSGGVTVVWGGAEQSELKAQVVDRLMRDKHRVYDVSAPSNPVTR